VSATVARLKREDPARFAQLAKIIKELPEHEIRSLDIGRGSFGDVMVALKERKGRSSVTVPARQLSDGTLRMLAIATALLTDSGGLDLDTQTLAIPPAPMLVVEELENGLHPSQASRVLELIKLASTDRDFQVVVTTHSPALLNALNGDDHRGVLIIDRDRKSGLSRIRRLVDVPGYLGVMAGRRLGEAVSSEEIIQRLDAEPNYADVNQLLGIA
jgi:predicted ATPase